MIEKIVSPDISHQDCLKMCRLDVCAEHKLSPEQALHIQSENVSFDVNVNVNVSFDEYHFLGDDTLPSNA